MQLREQEGDIYQYSSFVGLGRREDSFLPKPGKYTPVTFPSLATLRVVVVTTLSLSGVKEKVIHYWKILAGSVVRNGNE